MTKHTPGPWIVRGPDKSMVANTKVDIEEQDGAGYTVASAWGGGSAMGGAIEANARLIAAAPELLDALWSNLAAWEDEEDSVKHEHARLIRQTRALLTRIGSEP